MASSTKERTVPISRNETQLAADPHEPTTKSALEHFQEYGRERPESWPYGVSALASR